MSARVAPVDDPEFVAIEWPIADIDPVFRVREQYPALVTAALREAQRLGLDAEGIVSSRTVFDPDDPTESGHYRFVFSRRRA